MGARKHIKAEARKEALRSQYFAKLKDCPSSPRKMRYVVDMVRGMEVNRALGVATVLVSSAVGSQIGLVARISGIIS